MINVPLVSAFSMCYDQHEFVEGPTSPGVSGKRKCPTSTLVMIWQENHKSTIQHLNFAASF